METRWWCYELPPLSIIVSTMGRFVPVMSRIKFLNFTRKSDILEQVAEARPSTRLTSDQRLDCFFFKSLSKSWCLKENLGWIPVVSGVREGVAEEERIVD